MNIVFNNATAMALDVSVYSINCSGEIITSIQIFSIDTMHILA